jgi:hypothetical protein
VDERRQEEEESLAHMQAISWVQEQRQLWVHTLYVYKKRIRRENVGYG